MALQIQELREQRNQHMEVDLSNIAHSVGSSQDVMDENDPALRMDAALSLEGAYEQQLMVQYGDNIESRVADPGATPSGVGSLNPFRVHQMLKPGKAALISQAWDRHVADRTKISQKPRKTRQILMTDYFQEMADYMTQEKAEGSA